MNDGCDNFLFAFRNVTTELGKRKTAGVFFEQLEWDPKSLFQMADDEFAAESAAEVI